MRSGIFSSLRSLLALSLAIATALGGIVVLGIDGNTSDDLLKSEAAFRKSANDIAGELNKALFTVGRDVGIVAESVATLAAEANADSIDDLFRRWRKLHPDYADTLLADRTGHIRVVASGRTVGADLSGALWFRMALAGLVVGDAAEAVRAGVGVPHNIIVAAPVGGGDSARGVVAVQLSLRWLDAVVAAARRTLPDAGRNVSITVLNKAGRVLHQSGQERSGQERSSQEQRGQEQRGQEQRGHEVTASVGNETQNGLGWLVTVQVPESEMPGRSLLMLIGAVLSAAGIGWLIGGRLMRSLDYAEALCRPGSARPDAVFSLTRDLHALVATIRAASERSTGRERLLQEKRTALARSRDRIRAIRTLSGATCWEIDLAGDQVIWTDGDSSAAGTAPERMCRLADVLAHLEPSDRAELTAAFGAVEADPGSVREIVVRTRAGTGRASGRRLALRVAALGGPGTSRLYALSRKAAGHALPDRTSEHVSAGRARGESPRRILNGVVHGIDVDLAPAMTRPDTLCREAERDEPLSAIALRETERDTSRVASSAPGLFSAAEERHRDIVVFTRDAASHERTRVVSREAELSVIARDKGRIALVVPSLARDLKSSAARDATSALLAAAVLSDGQRDVSDDPPPLEPYPIALRSNTAPSSCFAALSCAESASTSSESALSDVSVALDIRTATGLLDRVYGRDVLEGRSRGSAVPLWFPGCEPRGCAADWPGAARVILLVEADPFVRHALAEALVSLGHAVTTAMDAEHAAEILASTRCSDMLLCDHVMPGRHDIPLAAAALRPYPAFTDLHGRRQAGATAAGIHYRIAGISKFSPMVDGAMLKRAEAA